MAEFDESDDLARLKQWWANNGLGLVLGVAIGVVVVAGWYGWQWYQDRQARQAAVIYGQVSQGLAGGRLTPGIRQAVVRLKQEYASSPYAAAAAMGLARYQLDQGHADKARAQLAWAADHADNAGMRSLARAREAGVLWSSGQPEAALDLLNQQPAAGFASLYAELRGDILAAQNNRRAAHEAYQQALAARGDNAPRARLRARISDTRPGATATQDQSSS